MAFSGQWNGTMRGDAKELGSGAGMTCKTDLTHLARAGVFSNVVVSTFVSWLRDRAC